MTLPRIMGHRGAAAHAPENTIAGLRRASSLGVTWVEFDAKLTADGRCVLFHDDTLERTTNGCGRVADTTYDEMSALDAGSWFGSEYAGERVPRLVAALGAACELDLGVDIEIKPCPGREVETAEAVMAEARDHWPTHRSAPLITSFNDECLTVAREVVPSWPRGLISLEIPHDWQARLAALDCRILACRHRHLTRRNVARIVGHGIDVLAFTVNDPKRAGRLLDWGVTTIISDAPDDIMASL
jgi:glycerophosphoryl diester phosphodiesterase